MQRRNRHKAYLSLADVCTSTVLAALHGGLSFASVLLSYNFQLLGTGRSPPIHQSYPPLRLGIIDVIYTGAAAAPPRSDRRQWFQPYHRLQHPVFSTQKGQEVVARSGVHEASSVCLTRMFLNLAHQIAAEPG